MVADKTMVDAFDSKADLESYIITLMGVVSNILSESVINYFSSINLLKVRPNVH